MQPFQKHAASVVKWVILRDVAIHSIEIILIESVKTTSM